MEPVPARVRGRRGGRERPHSCPRSRRLSGFATLFALALVALVPLTAPPATAGENPAQASAQRTYAKFGGHRQYKPLSFVFGAHSEVTGVSWDVWRKKLAIGHGQYQFNDCLPSCADGTITPLPGTLTLRGRSPCGALFIFKRMTLTYMHGGQTRTTGTKAFCPKS
jgi:hypothetical protein